MSILLCCFPNVAPSSLSLLLTKIQRLEQQRHHRYLHRSLNVETKELLHEREWAFLTPHLYGAMLKSYRSTGNRVQGFNKKYNHKINIQLFGFKSYPQQQFRLLVTPSHYLRACRAGGERRSHPPSRWGIFLLGIFVLYHSRRVRVVLPPMGGTPHGRPLMPDDDGFLWKKRREAHNFINLFKSLWFILKPFYAIIVKFNGVFQWEISHYTQWETQITHKEKAALLLKQQGLHSSPPGSGAIVRDPSSSTHPAPDVLRCARLWF